MASTRGRGCSRRLTGLRPPPPGMPLPPLHGMAPPPQHGLAPPHGRMAAMLPGMAVAPPPIVENQYLHNLLAQERAKNAALREEMNQREQEKEKLEKALEQAKNDCEKERQQREALAKQLTTAQRDAAKQLAKAEKKTDEKLTKALKKADEKLAKAAQPPKKRGKKPDEERWEQRLQELVDFKTKHGHYNVPRRDPQFAELARWVSTQKTYHKQTREGKPNGLPTNRIRRLKEIGFPFDPLVVAFSFQERVQQLAEYKEKHGHVNVPQLAKDCPAGLGEFVLRQRSLYKSLQSGKPVKVDKVSGREESNTLTPERIEALEALGFKWSLRNRRWKKRPREDEDMSAEQGDVGEGGPNATQTWSAGRGANVEQTNHAVAQRLVNRGGNSEML